jgi:hypothetical protein
VPADGPDDLLVKNEPFAELSGVLFIL